MYEARHKLADCLVLTLNLHNMYLFCVARHRDVSGLRRVRSIVISSNNLHIIHLDAMCQGCIN